MSETECLSVFGWLGSEEVGRILGGEDHSCLLICPSVCSHVCPYVFLSVSLDVWQASLSRGYH